MTPVLPTGVNGWAPRAPDCSDGVRLLGVWSAAVASVDGKHWAGGGVGGCPDGEVEWWLGVSG
jgi:hypothetical protein